jgi:hypothetical protein
VSDRGLFCPPVPLCRSVNLFGAPFLFDSGIGFNVNAIQRSNSDGTYLFFTQIVLFQIPHDVCSDAYNTMGYSDPIFENSCDLVNSLINQVEFACKL